MNSIKCPQCELVNWGTPPACKRCGLSFQDLPEQAFISVPAGEHVNAPGFPAGLTTNTPAQLMERARKVWKGFVAYCIFMALLYLFVAAIGGALLYLAQGSMAGGKDVAELRIQGVIFLFVGIALVIPYAIGPFVKGKSWGWVYGIVLIAIGLTSCCLWPATIPLIIHWVKPEMKAFFGQS
ncbi:MAG TPA: hypothetical protein VF553_15580 [Pyrinomonadaceae bacterium]|jgi:hypothetical protein